MMLWIGSPTDDILESLRKEKVYLRIVSELAKMQQKQVLNKTKLSSQTLRHSWETPCPDDATHCFEKSLLLKKRYLVVRVKI